MCSILYLGSECELPLISWEDAVAAAPAPEIDEDSGLAYDYSLFHILKSDDAFVSAILPQPFIYMIGAGCLSGCGCDFKWSYKIRKDFQPNYFMPYFNEATEFDVLLHKYLKNALRHQKSITLYCHDPCLPNDHVPTVKEYDVDVFIVPSFYFIAGEVLRIHL